MIVTQEFEAKTGGRLDALDVTEEVEEVVHHSAISSGNVLVFSPHTTCCVLIATPGMGMLAAMERAMHTIAPDDGYYAHDDLDIRTENLTENEPANAPAHIVHVFMGKASETICRRRATRARSRATRPLRRTGLLAPAQVLHPGGW